MSLFATLSARSLDVVDAAFDATSALARVILRGAFTPDARSYRSGRFATLATGDVLVQEVSLNAGDAAEAKKAIALDAERALPLAPDTVIFDVAGPVETSGRPRSRPERNFILGVVRKDKLIALRAELPMTRRGSVEAFVFPPPQQPGAALVFGDEIGRRRRRVRRALVGVALIILGVALNDAVTAWSASLDRTVATADAQRLQTERRIRIDERRINVAETALATQTTTTLPQLRDISQDLALIALHQPSDTETRRVTLDRGTLAFSGRSYSPDAAELQLRRAFVGQDVAFSPSTGEAPQTYEARLSPPTRGARR